MAELTEIEWADRTQNDWVGCQHAGPGCDNCFAEAFNKRFGGGVAPNWGPGAPRKRTALGNRKRPFRWNRLHQQFFAEHGRRQRIFASSLSDVFDNQVPFEWFADLFRTIELTPNLDWLVLTKRIGNVQEAYRKLDLMLHGTPRTDTRSNVWLGITVVDQAEATRDIPKLLKIPARVRFLSVEPMLGPIVIPVHILRQLDWVIVGGESGRGLNIRAVNPEWVRSLKDQCAAAGVPFLFKQWGQYCFPEQMPVSVRDELQKKLGRAYERAIGRPYRIGKEKAGRQLDGMTYDEFPLISRPKNEMKAEEVAA
ncbi:phage protein Gp37/Gp68 [Ostertagia ostertagi]